MLKINVLFFNISTELDQKFVLSVSKLLNAWCKKTMLAAVHATDTQLIAPWYMIQIFAHLAFYYIEHELFSS